MSSIILFLIKCVYMMLPGAFANMAPLIFRKRFAKLKVPLDFGKKIGNKRILGAHQTFRGFILGIAASIVVVYAQTFLYNYSLFQQISFFDYESFNPLALGFLIGFGVLFGDSAKSFVKRRLNIAP